MAEVKLSLPTNTPTVTFTKAQSAGVTPVNQAASYIADNSTKVRSNVPVAIVSYEPKTRTTVEGDLNTRIFNTVVAEGDTYAHADGEIFPKAVVVEADTNRRVSNSLEVDADTHGVITNKGFTIEGDLHGVITNSLEVEADTKRQVKVRVTVEASTCRTIVTDDEGGDEPVEPKTGAFVDKNTLYRLQHDTLNEDLTDNPYFDKLSCSLKNAAMLTRSQTIIKAINELFLAHRAQYNTAINMMRRFDSVIGNLAMDPSLREKYKKLNVNNVISALVSLNESLSTIQEVIGNEPEYDALGYGNIKAAIVDLKTRIDKTYSYWEGKTDEDLDEVFENLFSLTSYKNGIETRLAAAEQAIAEGSGGASSEEIERVRQELIGSINDVNRTLSERIDNISLDEDRVREIANEVMSGSIDSLEREMQNLTNRTDQAIDDLNIATSSLNTFSDQFRTYTETTNSTLEDFERRIQTLEASPDAAVTRQEFADYKEEINNNFSDYKEEIREDIRQILSALDGSTESGEAVSQVLLEYLHTEVDPLKLQASDLDNRVKALEDRINLPTGDVFTTNDICSEEDIREMFDQIIPGPDIDPISEADLESLIMTEEEVREMFEDPVDDDIGGSDTVSGGGAEDTVSGGTGEAGAAEGSDSGDGGSLDGDGNVDDDI